MFKQFKKSKCPITIDTSMTTVATGPTITSPSILSPTSPTSPTSPMSATSPQQQTPRSNSPQFSVEEVIKYEGYTPINEFGKTLQGSIWKVQKEDKKYVIKVTKKDLHNQSVTIINGNKVNVEENIIAEAAILRHLTSHNPPNALTKYHDFFCDNYYYYLVMEDGGNSFFDFIVKCHKFILKGLITIQEWHKFCKIAMKQILQLLDWMHNTMHCCHLDVSIENFVIDNAMVLVAKDGKIRFADDFQVKLCDFGLAEVFVSTNTNDEIDFSSRKYVGKTAYKSPKVFKKKEVFDAALADVWSLGICFFIMIIGGMPFTKPSFSDPLFEAIMKKNIISLLNSWNRIPYVDSHILDLMLKTLTTEKHRLNVKQILRHPWLL